MKEGDNIPRKTKSSFWRTKKGLEQIESWASEGMIHEEIAKKMGVATSTLYEYKKKYPEFSEALKRGEKIIDAEVEKKLLTRCLGGKIVKTTELIDKNTGKVTAIKKVIEDVLPETTACIFWLKNRVPEKWKDKQDVKQEIEINTNPFSGLTTEQLEQIINDEDW